MRLLRCCILGASALVTVSVMFISGISLEGCNQQLESESETESEKPVITKSSYLPLSSCEVSRSLSSSEIPGKLYDHYLPPSSWQEIKRVFLVILENTNESSALDQTFLKNLAANGAYFSQFYALLHPSQPNYIALVSGDLQGVTDNSAHEVDVQHIGNLLESKGKRWKVYSEGLPSNCPTTGGSGDWVRRHVPFLSFKNVASSPTECAKIVPSTELDQDIATGQLPEFSLYIPDNKNNGHDTGIAYADQAMSDRFGPLLTNPLFIDGTLFVMSFDESGNKQENQIYTAFYGAGVQSGATTDACYDHISLLATVEKIFDTGVLNKRDSFAPIIDSIWKN